jgi:hypothetical protein
MDVLTLSATPTPTSLSSAADNAPSVVFQPQRLKEIVEVVDLMGTVARRVREDGASDPAAAGSRAASQQGATGTSARDEAIAKAPPVAVMQKKLVEHLQQDRKHIQRQAKAIARSNAPGAAWRLTELYKKIRSLSSLITQILHASADMIKRFYIAAFIDHQPLVVTGGSLAPSDK